jgi:hypothetical protein
VIRLALHRSQTSHLPHKLSLNQQENYKSARNETHPANRLPVLCASMRIRDFPIVIIRSDEIQQNSTAFEDLDLAAVFFHVDERWDPTVGIDGEEPWFFLLVFAEV